MNVTREWYKQVQGAIEGLPEWMGEGEIWPAVQVVNAVNEQGQEQAKRLWWYLIVTHLDYDQVVGLGNNMTAHATHHAGKGIEQAGKDGVSTEHFAKIDLTFSEIDDARRALFHWVGTQEVCERYLDVDQGLFIAGLRDVRKLFGLPWNLPEWEKGDFGSLLLSACQYLGTLGVGAVDHEESWVIISWEGDSTRLNFKFGPTRNGDPDYLTSVWDTASPLTIIVEDLSGAFSSTFSLDGVMHDEFRQRLGITPKMSRQQIQVEFDKYCYRLPEEEVP